MKKLYRCPFWKNCDENPAESDCAAIRPKSKPCEHKVHHKHTKYCEGRGILPTCIEVPDCERHHIWCNNYMNPYDGCKMCKRLEKEYPMGNRDADQML
jgi:hypothetical protein